MSIKVLVAEDSSFQRKIIADMLLSNEEIALVDVARNGREAIQKVVAEYFAAIRAMDVEGVVTTFAEDAVSYDPVGGPAIKGHTGIRQFFLGMTAAFEKAVLTEDHVFIAGNGAAVKWTGHGVGKNGRKVHFEGIDVIEVNEQGKIQNLWAYWDPAAMMAELQG